MTNSTLTSELQRIAEQVRATFLDPATQPHFAPPAILQAVLAYPMAGGKALRPALLTWACQALGGPTDAALRAGAAVELYHTYTLVHDDIIDRDPVRRGQPSIHTLMAEAGVAEFSLTQDQADHYGMSMAILTGDMQQSWAIDLLASLPDLGVNPTIALRLIKRLQGVTGPAVMEGEALDIQLPFLPVDAVSAEMIHRVILTKTAALFAYCTWAGGMLAREQEDEDVCALTAFAERVGIAFQLQDDVLGLIGEQAKLGKPIGSDLREGKRTLIIEMAWKRATDAQRALLSSVLGNAQATPQAIADATDLLHKLGAIDQVQLMARTYLDRGLQYLDRLPVTPEILLLRETAELMVQREK